MLSPLLNRRQRIAPVPVYLALLLCQAICHSLFFTVQLVYQVTVIGLDPLQMVMVGVVLEVTCVLFEVPTGVVADVYSRRLSVLIGFVLMGCSYTLEGAVPLFSAALVSQIFWGVGYTFTSGATQAWITDEIGDDVVGPVFLRGEQARLVGLLIGTLLSVPLGVFNIQAPMLLAGAGMLALTAALTLVMPETHVVRASTAAHTTWAKMQATAAAGFRLAISRPVARVVIATSLVVGLAAEAFDRLATPSLIDRFTFPTLFGTNSPVLWFGVSGVVGIVLGLLAAELFRRMNPAALAAGTPARLLAALAAIDVAALVTFALSGSLWLAFAMLWVRRMAGAIKAPVEAAWLNRHLDSASRATVISMTGQANSIGQAAGAPAFGVIGNVVSIQAALLSSAVVLAPTVALYGRFFARERGAAAPVPTTAD